MKKIPKSKKVVRGVVMPVLIRHSDERCTSDVSPALVI